MVIDEDTSPFRFGRWMQAGCLFESGCLTVLHTLEVVLEIGEEPSHIDPGIMGGVGGEDPQDVLGESFDAFRVAGFVVVQGDGGLDEPFPEIFAPEGFEVVVGGVVVAGIEGGDAGMVMVDVFRVVKEPGRWLGCGGLLGQAGS